MDRQDLEAVVNSQKEQLSRYEKRLKDVVTAYKGLLKEKTALESSLAAFTSSGKDVAADSSATSGQVSSSSSQQQQSVAGDGGDDALREQVATLMNSLATLTAEKGRMESSFKSDRKQLRDVIAEKEGAIRDLEQQIKGLNYTIKTDLENCKSKFKQDREEECNGQLVMICELQKQLLDERHLNETLEMQLRDLKIQFNQKHSDRRVNEMPQAESERVRQHSELLESSKKENAALSSLLHQFQGEIENLKRQHAVAIRSEQKRVLVAEERSKKLEQVHEERVANLEARLAELSEVVGTYDRLRQQDQDSICKLKDKLSKIAVESNAGGTRRISQESNVERIVEEIGYMKNLLLAENAKLESPLDLSSLFTVHVEESVVPAQSTSLEDFRSLERNFEACLKENEVLKANIQIHKTNTKTLQEKIKVLNANIDDLEVEYKNKLIEHNNAIKTEKVRTQELITALESDFKSKLSQLEQQLKKQRERSLQLLEEKEEEIKSLRTSFDILMHDSSGQQQQHSNGSDPDHLVDNLPIALSKKINALNSVFKTDAASNPETHHILHYAHELARKEIEITALRTAKNNAEAALRQALHDKIASQEELHDRIAQLDEQIDRLERCKSREGANLEYLKNVVLSFLTSQDADGKKHMINAIAAVLKFSAAEMASIVTVDGGKR
ncbi:hypothetical protein pipiens_011044 [Culex pipiens pipiens]|uniref:GRIP domain-containing protein n=1 Tax=Culex pipiens pipiens TaxID=38569 RepID=A0ABD1D9F6_CULPP